MFITNPANDLSKRDNAGLTSLRTTLETEAFGKKSHKWLGNSWNCWIVININDEQINPTNTGIIKPIFFLWNSEMIQKLLAATKPVVDRIRNHLNLFAWSPKGSHIHIDCLWYIYVVFRNTGNALTTIFSE